MKSEDFKKLLKRFKIYVAGYITESCGDPYAFRLKEAHTYRVCGNIGFLSKKLNLSADDILLAKTMALFQDLGRFKQYRRYGTFNDRVSQNHAELGVAELAAHGFLSVCRQPEIELITSAIAHHNAAALPNGQGPRALLFTRLLRDADKLDIWKVFCDYYRDRRERPDEASNQTIELSLPDRPACSPPVVAALQAGHFARLEDLKTINDFKLLQISWVYDLNFQSSFCILHKRGYIDHIAATLPLTDEIRASIKKTKAFMHSRLQPEN